MSSDIFIFNMLNFLGKEIFFGDFWVFYFLCLCCGVGDDWRIFAWNEMSGIGWRWCWKWKKTSGIAVWRKAEVVRVGWVCRQALSAALVFAGRLQLTDDDWMKKNVLKQQQKKLNSHTLLPKIQAY